MPKTKVKRMMTIFIDNIAGPGGGYAINPYWKSWRMLVMGLSLQSQINCRGIIRNE